ncbi:MAG TPA: FGGY-family carbohydrate kinase, partial [Sedimentisphaerales bacterium]|nr:FGGY-family carbohydrate kinase [Sedimentisphaerales bacterium]
MKAMRKPQTTENTTILAVDIGTTGMKMGVFQVIDEALSPVGQFSQEYEVNIYNDGLFGDIEQDKWKQAFVAGCKAMAEAISEVDVISLSGTTPGLTAMDKNGEALYPAILMLDQRSRKQAQFIIDTVGLTDLLKTTANMPVAGGCSLASILWIKDNYPDIFARTHKFGHSNTYIAHWLTGAFAIDPSSASLTALYNTVANDLTWNEDIAATFGLALNHLPDIVPAYESIGRVCKSLAREMGFRKEPAVLIGGNDAVLAAYSVGIKNSGDIINVNGTCEIVLVCLDRCLPSADYNIRAHVLPDRWLTLHVMNAGGKALDWFRELFCSELSTEEFYNGFLPKAIESWLDRESGVTYMPYLMGSRYSLEPLKAQLSGLTHQTTREEILAAIVRGLCEYQKAHLDEIEKNVSLQNIIHVTGGATNPALIRAKSKWMRDCEYVYDEQSSMKGAALLGLKYIEN